jgi:hypothetical protein
MTYPTSLDAAAPSLGEYPTEKEPYYRNSTTKTTRINDRVHRCTRLYGRRLNEVYGGEPVPLCEGNRAHLRGGRVGTDRKLD